MLVDIIDSINNVHCIMARSGKLFHWTGTPEGASCDLHENEIVDKKNCKHPK